MYSNYNDKVANLKAEIDMNMVPNIQHAGGSPEYCFAIWLLLVMHINLQRAQVVTLNNNAGNILVQILSIQLGTVL